MLSIVLSFVDWGLHVAFAVWLYYNGEDKRIYANLCIAALVVAWAVNFFAIVRYIQRNTSDPASSLLQRINEYPENAAMVGILGTINVEMLIFLSEEDTDHSSFRALGLLTNMFEGIPILCFQAAFVTLHPVGWHPLIIVSLEHKVKYVSREKEVFSRLNHPFFVRLYFTFQDKEKLCIRNLNCNIIFMYMSE